ncbi:MAG: hypothetical protein ACYCW6_04705 [Candidatus Xenobia bacterium]
MRNLQAHAPSSGRPVRRPNADIADRIIQVLHESAGGHGVEAGLNLGVARIPRVKPVGVVCPECHGPARQETLDVWSRDRGWRSIERLVCLAKGNPETRCAKITVLREGVSSQEEPPCAVAGVLPDPPDEDVLPDSPEMADPARKPVATSYGCTRLTAVQQQLGRLQVRTYLTLPSRTRDAIDHLLKLKL